VAIDFQLETPTATPPESESSGLRNEYCLYFFLHGQHLEDILIYISSTKQLTPYWEGLALILAATVDAAPMAANADPAVTPGSS